MKRSLVILMIGVMFSLAASAQAAYIHQNKNLMFQSSLNGKSLAWRSESFGVLLNKWTGELVIDIPIDYLYVKELNPDFTPTGESAGKVISLRGVVPVNDVLQEGAEFMNVPVEVEIFFNGTSFRTGFVFSVFKMFPNGFSVQADGRFPHSYFGIESLKDAEDEIVLVFSFSGE